MGTFLCVTVENIKDIQCGKRTNYSKQQHKAEPGYSRHLCGPLSHCIKNLHYIIS